MSYSTFGRHVAMDTWGISFDVLNDLQKLKNYLQQAAIACGATVLSVQAQKFEPQGVTVLVMLSESHLSIHTYPEKGFAALDCYTCGNTVDPMVAITYMLEVLRPSQSFPKVLHRGDGPISVVEPNYLVNNEVSV